MQNPIPPVTGSAGAVASLETSPGVWNLISGNSATAAPLLYRDVTSFKDNGSTYEANLVIGSMMLANPGELAELGFITADFIRTGTSPKVYVLFDEIDGTLSQYGNISGYTVQDPPLLWGATGHPQSLFSNRYYFKQTDVTTGGNPQPAYCRHLCILIDYGATDTVQNEALSVTLYGSILVEQG
jgi:hypothetical protein